MDNLSQPVGYLGSHDGNLGSGPGVVHVSPQMLGAHHVVRSSVRLPRDHRNLGHRGLRVRKQQLGPVSDDAVVLFVGSWNGNGNELVRLGEWEWR